MKLRTLNFRIDLKAGRPPARTPASGALEALILVAVIVSCWPASSRTAPATCSTTACISIVEIWEIRTRHLRRGCAAIAEIGHRAHPRHQRLLYRRSRFHRKFARRCCATTSIRPRSRPASTQTLMLEQFCHLWLGRQGRRMRPGSYLRRCSTARLAAPRHKVVRQRRQQLRTPLWRSPTSLMAVICGSQTSVISIISSDDAEGGRRAPRRLSVRTLLCRGDGARRLRRRRPGPVSAAPTGEALLSAISVAPKRRARARRQDAIARLAGYCRDGPRSGLLVAAYPELHLLKDYSFAET